MATQTVRLENPDGKFRVAYDMALMLWRNANAGESPGFDEQDAFLDLVARCIQSLNTASARRV